MTQDFFKGAINNLRTQAENNRALSDDLIEQQRKQQEASQALTQESLGAYMDFLDSMFSYYRGNLDEAQRQPVASWRRGVASIEGPGPGGSGPAFLMYPVIR